MDERSSLLEGVIDLIFCDAKIISTGSNYAPDCINF